MVREWVATRRSGRVPLFLVVFLASLSAITVPTIGQLDNDPPVAVDDVYTVWEDNLATLSPLDNDWDPNENPVSLVSATNSSHGGLVEIAPGNQVNYTPPADFNGDDSFTYTITDGFASATATVNLTVTAVNDPPTFTLGPDLFVPLGATAQTVPGWATSISPGPSDESGQAVFFSLTASAPELFLEQPTLDENGTLRFTPVTNATGTSTISVDAWDDGNLQQEQFLFQSEVLIIPDGPALPTFNVTIAVFPIPDFTVSDTSVVTNEPVTFTDMSTDPDGETVTVMWDFGDGDQSEGSTPTHRFTQPGTYPVTLSATDADGATNETTKNVVVTLAALRSDFLVDGTLFEVGANATFENNVTGGRGDITYVWDFRDGNTSTTEDASHAWERVGAYNVKLTAQDGTGATSFATKTIRTYARLDAGSFFEGDYTLDAAFPDGFGLLANASGVGGVFYSMILAASQDAVVEPNITAINGPGGNPYLVPFYYFAATEGDGHTSDQVDNVTLFLDYDDAAINAQGVIESTLAIHYWNGARWVNTRTGVNATGSIPGSTPDRDLRVFSAGVDTVANRVFAVVNHTSVYAVAGHIYLGGGGSYVPPAATAPASSPAPSDPAAPSDAASPAPAPAPAPAAPGDGSAGTGSLGTGTGSASSTSEKGILRIKSANGTEPSTLDALTGAVLVEYVAPDGTVAPAQFVLVGRDGSEHVLARDNESAAWNTAEYQNGEYTLEARQHRADGSFDVLASETVIVYNSRTEAVVAAAAVVAATALVATGSAVTGAAASRVFVALDAAREGLFAVGEDNVKERHKNRVAARGGRTRVGPITSAVIAVVLLSLFFTIEGIQGFVLADFLDNLPIVGTAALTFFALAFALEYAAARASGVRATYRFLASGAVALAFSSVAFRSAFGLPGYVDEAEATGRSEQSQKRMKALRSIGFLGGMTGLLVLFQYLGSRGHYGVMDAGLAIGLATLATSALPFKPLPGSNVWLWRKSVSIALVVLTFWMYMGFLVATLPWTAITVSAFIGMAAYVVALAWLRLWSLPTPPAWYARAATAIDAMMASVYQATPALVLRSVRGLDRGIDAIIAATAKAIVAAIVFLTKPFMRRPGRAAASATSSEAGLADDVQRAATGPMPSTSDNEKPAAPTLEETPLQPNA